MRATALILALLATACGGDPAADATPAAEARPGHRAHGAHEAAPPVAGVSDLSVYNLPSLWRDRTAAERPLSSLAGRPRVVAMVYTSCGYACPRLILDMKRIEAELGEDSDVGLVLVSIDPDRDTPARLAEFAAGARLDPARWTLLTAGDDAVLELAAVLGVQYREAGPGEFVHSNVLTVLDRNGVIVHRQEGLGAEPAASVEALRGL